MSGDAWFGALLWVVLILYWWIDDNSIRRKGGEQIRSRILRVLIGVFYAGIVLAILSPFNLPFAGPMWRSIVCLFRFLIKILWVSP